MTGADRGQDVRALMARAEAGDAAAQLRVSQLFRQASDGERARHWLEKAVAQGFPAALGERGMARLARLDLNGAVADLNAASLARDGSALLALAGLAATGAAPELGGWAQGIARTIDSALAGNKVAWRELALLAAMAGEGGASQRLMSHAAALGDGIAVYAILARAHRDGFALDIARARAYRAALKHLRFPLPLPEGGGEAESFPPPGDPPPMDWDALAAALHVPPGLEFSAAERASAAPDIWVAHDFLTAEECDYVVASGVPSLVPARVIDPVSGEGRQDGLRTNLAASEATAWMSPAKAALALRLAKFSGLSLDLAEPAGLLCYRPGQEYRPHFDWLGPGPLFDQGGQRMRTVLVYLNEDYTGGQTRFLTPGFDIPARKGTAALFVNAGPDGAPDMTTRHAGMPVLTGVKYVWSQWYRERRVMPLTQ